MSTNTPASPSCPECGEPAEGKFCAECGAEVQARCPQCDTPRMENARFCHECGSGFDGSAAEAPPANIPAPRPPAASNDSSGHWLTVGAVGAALAIVGGITILDRNQGDVPSFSPGAESAGTANVPQPPDISSLTPREAAERLFNRVMAATEQGDSAEANRFVPMALMAYEQLGELDTDSHYHVGLIRTVAEDADGAEVEREAMRRAIPDHLLGFMLEHSIAELRSDEEAMSRASQGFLDALDAELALERPEYRDHANGIELFRERADEAES